MDEKQKLQQIAAYSHKKMTKDRTGHGYDHIRRVAGMAEKICRPEGADRFITLTAAYLHDVIDDKLVADSAKALEELMDFLKGLGVTAGQCQEVKQIITNMSFASTLDGKAQPLSLEGQIVQDADWLDAIGAIGIVRAVYFGGVHGERIYNPNIAPRKQMTKEEYRNLDNETIINHFYEKLLKIKDMLNTQTARQIAASRQQFMLDFLAEFKAEWDAER